jgi:hypothetical protein
MRIEGSLAAHFNEQNGPSRPGIMWTVGLKHGEETYKVMVKGLLADDATPETRENKGYQAETVMQYLNDQLNSGWHPKQEKEYTIYIGNPLSSSSAETPAPVPKKRE